MISEILPDFQKYLTDNRLVKDNHAPFYALWVNKFLNFSNHNEGVPIDLQVTKFIDSLHQQELEDWKVNQAKTAMDFYIHHFHNGDMEFLSPNMDVQENGSGDAQASDLIEKLREAIRLKHYAYSTERSYIDWVKRFFEYVVKIKKKHAQRSLLDSSDVRDFLSHLAIRQRVSASTQNQAFNALLFLFRDVLNVDLKDLNKTVRAKRGLKLPVVLSVDEVKRMFDCVEGKDQLIIHLTYGTGMRLMELVRLRVKDVDFDSGLIFIRGSKGDKDRSTMLPKLLKERLIDHLRGVKALHEKDLELGYGDVYLPDAMSRKYPNAGKDWGWQYVFPSQRLSVDPRSGKVRRHHMDVSTVQKLVKNAVKKAGLVKLATVHTLRHSFATHLLMDGVNIREVQELLGHKNVETTMIYTHVIRDMSKAPMSPLDKIFERQGN